MVMLHFYKHEKFVKIHPDADHKSLTSSRVVLLALRRKQFRLHLSFFCKFIGTVPGKLGPEPACQKHIGKFRKVNSNFKSVIPVA